MKMLMIGLSKIGFGAKVTSVLSRWNELPLVANRQPVTEYQYAYPDDLMNEIAELFLIGLRESGFALVSPEKLEKKEPDSIVHLLNEAWELFWSNPEAFTDWEGQTVQRLKTEILKCNVGECQ